MELSIIIVSWNTRDLLAHCLDSVYAFRPEREFEVWVVDNASSDGSAAMVRQRFPQVCVIENPQNLGFARANNQAIRKSTGRYVLLLNSDTIVRPCALQNLMAFMDEHAEAGIVGARLLDLDGAPQRCFGDFPTLLSETFLAWGLETHWPFSTWFGPGSRGPEVCLETGWVQGAALLTRRDLFQSVGLLDEDFFMFSEEIDLAYRAWKSGWKNFVLESALIIHLGQQSTGQIPSRMKAELFRSKILFFSKHYGATMSRILSIIFIFSIYAKCLAYGFSGKQALTSLWCETAKRFVAQPLYPVQIALEERSESV